MKWTTLFLAACRKGSNDTFIYVCWNRTLGSQFFKPVLLNEPNINVDRTLLLTFLVGLFLRVPRKLLSSDFSGPAFIPDITVNTRGTWLDLDPQTCLPQQRWSLWAPGRQPASPTCSPSLWTPPKCGYRWAHLAQTHVVCMESRD